MNLEIKENINGDPIYLYSQIIHLNKVFSKQNRDYVLKSIDELVKVFSKEGKFVDTFYLWNKFSPNEITLVKRSISKLNEKEAEMVERKFDLFSSTVKKMFK